MRVMMKGMMRRGRRISEEDMFYELVMCLEKKNGGTGFGYFHLILFLAF